MSEAVKTNPKLWEAAKKEATAKMGGHSARAMQLAVQIYKKKGGGYKGEKSASNSLAKWTKQDWRTKSGKPSKETGERYLPAKAIKALSPAEYAATTKAKRAGGGTGKTVKQPAKIAKKVARFTK